MRRKAACEVADEVAPGNPNLGVMLPYTPLHHLLIRAFDGPLVLSSGNPSDDGFYPNGAPPKERNVHALEHGRIEIQWKPGTPQNVIDVLNMLNDEVKVDNMMISPAYAYEKAPDQEHFLGVEETRELFRKAFADGRRSKWRLNHTPLFLDFLEGKTDFGCTAWGIPSYSLLGWQKPCYLMSDGYVKTYKELIETTDWDSYGRGKDPRCANCMAHCGYEPSAVLATMSSLRETIRAARGN